jgi:hypothetical protein
MKKKGLDPEKLGGIVVLLHGNCQVGSRGGSFDE